MLTMYICLLCNPLSEINKKMKLRLNCKARGITVCLLWFNVHATAKVVCGRHHECMFLWYPHSLFHITNLLTRPQWWKITNTLWVMIWIAIAITTVTPKWLNYNTSSKSNHYTLNGGIIQLKLFLLKFLDTFW